ncbi:MAG: sulfatase-like hydrolase/transferase [Rhodospirillaceae bacterium]
MTEADPPARRRPWAGVPVYPVLIAAWFPLNAMAENFGMFRLADIARPIAVGMAGAAVLVALFAVVGRDRHRAAFRAALIVVFAGLLDHLAGGLQSLASAVGLRLLSWVAMAVVAGAFALAAWRLRPGAGFTVAANVALCAMLALPAVQVIDGSVARSQIASEVETAAAAQRQALRVAIPPASPRPNIVHIVLDGYSRQDVLAETYGFDNGAFIDRLKARGFAVAGAATTPYNRTLFAMASVLSARYVDAALPEDDDSAESVLVERLQRNDVMAVLDDLGYQIAAVDSIYDPVRFDDVDRFFVSSGTFNNFERTLVQASAPLRFATLLLDGWESSADRIRRKLGVNPHRALEAPFFLYMHLIAPHPPFDVDAEGRAVKGGIQMSLADGSHHRKHDPDRRAIYREGYVAKLQFINRRIEAYLDRLLAEVPDPKVVVVHGDHGSGLCLDHDHRDRTAAKERYAPLLAVYSSDGSVQRGLPADFNLVNLYRHVLNTAFGAKLPLLESRHYFVPWDRPFAPEPIPAAELAAGCTG